MTCCSQPAWQTGPPQPWHAARSTYEHAAADIEIENLGDIL